MFRRVNIANNTEIDKFILMKNSRDEFCEIDKKFVTNIRYEFQNYSTMTLSVPNFLMKDGQRVYNPLYDKILGKRQQILFGNERYVIDEMDIDSNSDGSKTKSVTALSFEKTLEDSNFVTGTITRQLYCGEDEVNIGVGILDEFIIDNKSWKIGVVSDKARKEVSRVDVEYEKTLYETLNIANISRGMKLWEKSFDDIDVFDNNSYITLKIFYKSIKSYDVVSNKFLKDEQETHKGFGNLHSGISKIEAYYDGNDVYRYAIKYIVTFKDGLTRTYWEEFTNVDNLKCEFTSIKLFYTNGEEDEIECVKIRSFDEGVYKWIDFLRTDISQAYDVVFVFDTYNRILNCYHIDEIGTDNGLVLSYDNYIKNINQKLQFSELCNKLYVTSEFANISDINPLGQDFLLDYSYYLKNGLMSYDLEMAWYRYLDHLESGIQEEILEKRLSLNGYNKQKIKLESEKTTLEENIKGLESIRVAYMKSNDEQNVTRISAEINTKKSRFEEILKEIQVCKDNIDQLNSDIKTLVESITVESATDSIGKIFTDELLTELSDLTIVMEINDETSLTNYTLYDTALAILKERNKLNIQFTTSLVGLLQKLPKGLKWNEVIKVGDFVTIEEEAISHNETEVLATVDGEEILDYENDMIILTDEERKIRIMSFEFNPSKYIINSIEFSNANKRTDALTSLSSVGRSITKNANYTNSYKEIWKNSRTTNDYITSMLTDGMDLKAQAIKSRSETVKIDMSESGIFLIDASNEDNQLYLSSSMLAITNNRWLNCKTAIDENGIYGKEIIGEIILGHKLHITSELGEFYVGNMDESEGFGLAIKEDNVLRVFLGTEMVNGVRRARLRLINPEGELVLSENGVISTGQQTIIENLSKDFDLTIPFIVDGGTSSLKSVKLTLLFEKYRAYNRGGSFGGSISETSDSGGGFSISSSTDGGGGVNINVDTPQEYLFTSEESVDVGNIYDDSGLTRLHNHTLYHKHNFSVYTEPHFHEFSISQNSHVHEIKLDEHAHPESYGIYVDENSEVSNAKVYVNDVLVSSNINSNTVIDITSKLRINSTNYIKITNEKNVRVSVNIFEKKFVIW